MRSRVIYSCTRRTSSSLFMIFLMRANGSVWLFESLEFCTCTGPSHRRRDCSGVALDCHAASDRRRLEAREPGAEVAKKNGAGGVSPLACDTR
jgi:hypothetical protein